MGYGLMYIWMCALVGEGTKKKKNKTCIYIWTDVHLDVCIGGRGNKNKRKIKHVYIYGLMYIWMCALVGEGTKKNRNKPCIYIWTDVHLDVCIGGRGNKK